jgi:hypothetical protein
VLSCDDFTSGRQKRAAIRKEKNTMRQPVTAILAADFSDPEEGTTATVDRLVMAASYWKVSDAALRSLVHLTALACASQKVISMSMPQADLDELIERGLVRYVTGTSDRVVLI